MNYITIEVEGHGISRTMPDLVTLTFSFQQNIAAGGDIYLQIEEAKTRFIKSLESWLTKDDVIRIASCGRDVSIPDGQCSTSIEVRITTSRLDELTELIRLGGEYGTFECSKTKYGLTPATEQAEREKALKMAIDDAGRTCAALSISLAAAALNIRSVKVTEITQDTDDSSTLNTFTLGSDSFHQRIKPVVTAATVSVSYATENTAAQRGSSENTFEE